MIAFVVSVNGQQVGTYGIGDSGVVSAHVTWVGRPPDDPGDLSLSVGGLDSRTDEQVRWPDPPEIKIGDSITIRVIETNTVDTPIDRRTPAQMREEERVFLAEMEAERQDRFMEAGQPLPESSDPDLSQRRVRRDLDDELPPFAAPWEQP